MQAKVIATGEIKEIKEVKLEDKYILPDCIEIVNEIDWEQRRFELVKSIFPQIASFVKEALLRGNKIENSEGKTTMQVVAEISINYADAVIEKLKEE